MKPYYDDGKGIVIYHGDCREVLPALALPADALVVADPPYGVSERTDRKAKGRSYAAACYDFAPVYDDDKPFDPAHLLTFKRLVLWGANHFAERLPASPSWLVWDKRDGIASNDNADCELAWSNLGGPARVFRHLWSGMIKASERDQRRLHPTQKPVALGSWLLQNWSKPGDTVVEPYMGGGFVLRAAKDLGRRAIGIEIEERYCEIAARRLSQEVLALGGAS